MGHWEHWLVVGDGGRRLCGGWSFQISCRCIGRLHWAVREVVGLRFGVGGGGIALDPYNESSSWLLWEIHRWHWRVIVNGCAWQFHYGG